jgi:hypothetical protein
MNLGAFLNPSDPPVNGVSVMESPGTWRRSKDLMVTASLRRGSTPRRPSGLV